MKEKIRGIIEDCIIRYCDRETPLDVMVDRTTASILALLPRWVPVSERLPSKAGRYPVISRIDECSCLDTLYFSKKGEWYEGAVCEFDVKHDRRNCHLVRTVFAWLNNLPAAPQEEE